MAYAYLFKYIIIGDTGKGPGRGGAGSLARGPGLKRERRLAAARTHFSLPAPPSGPRGSISAVLELVTWALRAARPGRARATAPAPAVLAGEGRGGLHDACSERC